MNVAIVRHIDIEEVIKDLISNTLLLDRSPVFAIEVDGFAFHENKPEQLERDKRKERIFKKFGLDLHRFRTNESDEERRLRELLDSEISKRIESDQH